MSATRRITVARLAEEFGIRGDTYFGDWDDPAIQDSGSERGLAWVVLVDDCRFWRLEIEFHPEDWDGTNDLWERRNQPEHEFGLEEVVPVMRRTWDPAPSVKVHEIPREFEEGRPPEEVVARALAHGARLDRGEVLGGVRFNWVEDLPAGFKVETDLDVFEVTVRRTEIKQ